MKDKLYDDLFGEMSLDFVKLIKQQNPEKYEKAVMNEIYTDLLINQPFKHQKEHLQQVFAYISKYSFLLLHLERMQEFERCANIKKALVIFLIETFNVKEEKLLKFIEISINDLKTKI